MTCRTDAHEGCTCERCVNWHETPQHVVLSGEPVVLFAVGLCVGDESDHFGHLVVNEHPACKKLIRRQT